MSEEMIELTDNEIENISGGKDSEKKKKYSCQACGKTFKAYPSEINNRINKKNKKENSLLCPECGNWKASK